MMPILFRYRLGLHVASNLSSSGWMKPYCQNVGLSTTSTIMLQIDQRPPCAVCERDALGPNKTRASIQPCFTSSRSAGMRPGEVLVTSIAGVHRTQFRGEVRLVARIPTIPDHRFIYTAKKPVGSRRTRFGAPLVHVNVHHFNNYDAVEFGAASRAA